MRTLAVILAFATASQAHAARQLISCKSAEGYKVTMDFDPEVTIETIWKHNKKHGDYIQTIVLGERDTKTETTARVAVIVPKSEFKAPYSGTMKMMEFYDVNTREKAGSGYSYRFDNKAYRGFHGHDGNMYWDMMVYFPESVLGQNAKGFPGLATIQMDLMDQGYYHIDLKCNSRIK